jgi:hypothetical protein
VARGLRVHRLARHTRTMTWCTCARGWVCRQHPALPWPHEDCPGPGAPCENAACLWASRQEDIASWWGGGFPGAFSLVHPLEGRLYRAFQQVLLAMPRDREQALC